MRPEQVLEFQRRVLEADEKNISPPGSTRAAGIFNGAKLFPCRFDFRAG
jgi:hypothetical protein